MCRSWKALVGAGGLTVGHPLFRRAVALVASVAWGCTNFVEPPLPSGAVPMAMPPQYALWWRLVCTIVKPFFNDDTLPTIRVEPQP